MKTDELKTILADHIKWLRGETLGKRADLRSADLNGAVLSGAVLSGVDLRSADLRSADLRSADLSGAILSGAVLRSADLRSADLSGAVLSGADLSGAVLSRAVLSRADLSESRGFLFAQVSWTGHGECGRMLSAVQLPDGLKLFCGCFSGSVEDMRAYIANGAEEHRESRTKALEFVLSCF